MNPEIRGTFLGLTAAAGALGLCLGLSAWLQPQQAITLAIAPAAEAPSAAASPAVAADALRGRDLFDHNCAHCHGEDARGDEGPNLHDLAKSDARISAIIRGGIKGEMPAFGKKFTDADVGALIAFLRTLKD